MWTPDEWGRKKNRAGPRIAAMRLNVAFSEGFNGRRAEERVLSVYFAGESNGLDRVASPSSCPRRLAFLEGSKDSTRVCNVRRCEEWGAELRRYQTTGLGCWTGCVNARSALRTTGPAFLPEASIGLQEVTVAAMATIGTTASTPIHPLHSNILALLLLHWKQWRSPRRVKLNETGQRALQIRMCTVLLAFLEVLQLRNEYRLGTTHLLKDIRYLRTRSPVPVVSLRLETFDVEFSY